jgi:hypothetical protein
MAQPMCPKCERKIFEIKELSPKNSKWKYNFVQCATCGCVVGVVDYYNLGALIHRLASKMNIDLEAD